ncbi:hypothetical protein [Pseudomonas guariconensis]|uniref:hypothetical protein n=1 Tax=Pseudomonas guariconensis TaxID=1288410 RepID=UPI0018A9C209|nr:hypothetical protein [Pseudomonas guariconensis]MBF8757995.1 hypothetical protein [Pseudomonas guariconensis]
MSAQAQPREAADSALLALLRRHAEPLPHIDTPAFGEQFDALVRKIGAPGNEEFALGAVAEGNPPYCVADQAVMALFGASQAWPTPTAVRAACCGGMALCCERGA